MIYLDAEGRANEYEYFNIGDLQTFEDGKRLQHVTSDWPLEKPWYLGRPGTEVLPRKIVIGISLVNDGSWFSRTWRLS